MTMSARFPIPADVSLFQSMVAAASLGWRSQILISGFETGMVEYGLWLKHYTWHGSLCEVGWHTGFLPRTDAAGIMAEDTLGAALRGILPGLMDLWRDFPDSVPCFVEGRPVVNTIETAIFPDYLAGTRPVRFPERMNPVYALPGWPGQPEIASIFSSADPLRGCLDAALKRMAERCGQVKAMAHMSFSLDHEPYFGGGCAAQAIWHASMAQYPRRIGASARYDGRDNADLPSLLTSLAETVTARPAPVPEHSGD